ncbi:MAG: protein kinase, partial [Gemmatimonadetes bacterium]|nr:protein kinase [Gemmatimonadota bacterium]
MASPRTCDQCGEPLPPEGRFCSHCGSLSGSPESAPNASASTRLGPWERILERLRTVTAGRYDVQRLLGWGGMAGVYLAEELRLKRRVAIKVIAPGLLMDPSQIERFEQEARTTAQLNHPNIVTIFEVDEREDLHYFTMTYVPGRALSQVMAEAAASLPIDVVRAWVRQVSGALSYAHQRGVVHRDIKPGNILLDEHGNALVGDFGIAKVAEEPGLTRTGMLVGTPAYMSPEQCTT